jgi:eukaryotic-like serine/threonine-protein kinase
MGVDERPTPVAHEEDAPTRVLGDQVTAARVDRPGTVTPTPLSISVSSHPGGLELPRPESVLRRSEIDQTRRTAQSGVLFNAAGLVIVPFFGGDPVAYWGVLLGLAVAVLNNAWLWFVSVQEHRYHQKWVVLYFIVAPIPNALILYYVGVFGPLLAMFVYNVYTACLEYDRAVARVTLVASALPITVLGGLMALGVLDDPGMVSAGATVGAAGQITVVVGFDVFLVLTYAQARRSRELLVASLVERDAAVRAASHREALFLEARQDLERALHAGGLGRFTDQVVGSYRLGCVLGRGGMGEVYEAAHVETGALAAVKLLRTDLLGQPDLVRRFLREVHTIAAIRSDHVVRVVEIGDESVPVPYLAMERLRGQDLGQILRERERLHASEVVELVRQAARGIDVASAAGIVHRDIKPQNLFRTEGVRPIWKILDFGISKLAHTSDTLTHGETIGTPHYMAPEQALGKPLDDRADHYALAAIAYRALTGHQPFSGDELAAVLVKVVGQMPVRPSALVEVPPEVDAVFAVALAKRPEDRFASTDALVSALEAALRGEAETDLRRRAHALLRRHPWTEPS